MSTTPEIQIQRDIVRFIRDRGMFVFSVPNEHIPSRGMVGQLIASGMVPGAADLCVMLGRGRVAFIEVKNEIGHQSEVQKAFERKCAEYGLPYRLVRSVAETEEFLNGLQMGS